jgi:hypothetical protein
MALRRDWVLLITEAWQEQYNVWHFVVVALFSPGNFKSRFKILCLKVGNGSTVTE